MKLASILTVVALLVGCASAAKPPPTIPLEQHLREMQQQEEISHKLVARVAELQLTVERQYRDMKNSTNCKVLCF